MDIWPILKIILSFSLNIQHIVISLWTKDNWTCQHCTLPFYWRRFMDSMIWRRHIIYQKCRQQLIPDFAQIENVFFDKKCLTGHKLNTVVEFWIQMNLLVLWYCYVYPSQRNSTWMAEGFFFTLTPPPHPYFDNPLELFLKHKKNTTKRHQVSTWHLLAWHNHWHN